MDAPITPREEFTLLMTAFTNLILELRDCFPGEVLENEIQRSVAKIQETFQNSRSFVIFNRTIISQMQNLEFYRVYWNFRRVCKIPQSSAEPEEVLPNCA